MQQTSWSLSINLSGGTNWWIKQTRQFTMRINKLALILHIMFCKL